MINKEYLTVGELAKEMDVTVRTLQYYYKEGLLKPSMRREGVRRLYIKKDMINEFTGGDMSLIPDLMKFNESKGGVNEEMLIKQKFIDDFIGQAIEAYFEKQNIII